MTALDRDIVRNALTFYMSHFSREAKSLDALAKQFDDAAAKDDADAARRCVQRATVALQHFNTEHKD